MEGETKKRDLQSLLESIRSSEVLESRISLINQIEETYQTDASNLVLLIEWLVVSYAFCVLNMLSFAMKFNRLSHEKWGQKIHLMASEILKVAEVVLDAAIKLCRAYFQTIRQDSMEMRFISRGKGSQEDSYVDYTSHIVSMTATTMECLFELGVFAASGGGNLVTVLNLSWKGVVLLLQLSKGALAERVSICDIILSLISLAMETLRCAAEAWSSTLKETLTVSEAKRAFLPIKFYLINAVRISSEYSCKAVDIYRELSRCVLLISSLGILLSKEIRLRAASEALVEFLEPTSFLLLHTLLNSADVKFESKIQILEWIFTYAMDSSSMDTEIDIHSSEDSFISIFTVSYDAIVEI